MIGSCRLPDFFLRKTRRRLLTVAGVGAGGRIAVLGGGHTGQAHHCQTEESQQPHCLKKKEIHVKQPLGLIWISDM